MYEEKASPLPKPFPLSWAACGPHCELPSSCSFTKEGLNGSHCSIFISRMVVVGVTGRREMDWLWHPQTFPPSSLTQHHHGWVARVDVRSLFTRVQVGWDNATLYEIDSGGKGVYCQLARGGGGRGEGAGGLDWLWFPSPKWLALLQAWADTIKTGLLRNTHGGHEHISGAVEESTVEKGARSGTF